MFLFIAVFISVLRTNHLAIQRTLAVLSTEEKQPKSKTLENLELVPRSWADILHSSL